MSADVDQAKVELVKATCGHFIPRPEAWRTTTLQGLSAQAQADLLAARLGTPYYTVVELQGHGEVRMPVTLCDPCRERVETALALARSGIN